MIIAFCENCHGIWRTEGDPTVLQGSCMECQADSDAEKPLTFGLLLTTADCGVDDLPEEWLV
jgi:hypothetical protein